MRKNIEDKLKNNQFCDETLFDGVFMEVYSCLKGDSFSRFLTSFLFQEFCRTIDNELFKSFATLKT